MCRAMRPTMCRGCPCCLFTAPLSNCLQPGTGKSAISPSTVASSISTSRCSRRRCPTRPGSGWKTGRNSRTKSCRPQCRPSTGLIRAYTEQTLSLPPHLVTSRDAIWQEGRRLLPLRVYPFQYNPVTGELRYHPEIRIQVRITSAAAAVQPESAPVWRPAAPQALAGTGGTLRIRTAAAGMVRLTYADLAAKGVPLATTDTATFAMTYLGQPVDIRVLDGGNSRLDPGELVVFYAEAYSGRYSNENVYFFSYGGAAGARMASRTVTPSGNEPTLTSIIRTARVEESRGGYYQHLPCPRRPRIISSTPRSMCRQRPRSARLPYTLNLVDPVTTGNDHLSRPLLRRPSPGCVTPINRCRSA